MSVPTDAEMLGWLRAHFAIWKTKGDEGNNAIVYRPGEAAEMVWAIADRLEALTDARPNTGKAEPGPTWQGEPC